MQYKFLEGQIDYDGSQLRSLFAYLDHGILGDSVVAFTGSCDVSFDHMVDGEDLLLGATIRGAKMLHFIVEEFGASLELAVTRQRLFASLAFEELGKLLAYGTLKKNDPILEPINGFFRSGDDLYFGEHKLSISIATLSPVSSLMHFAVNINNEKTPVKTKCLEELGIEPRKFADALAGRFVQEVKTIKEACCKVRWVK